MQYLHWDKWRELRLPLARNIVPDKLAFPWEHTVSVHIILVKL